MRFVVEEIEQNPLARRITVDPETRRRLRDHRSDEERAAEHEADVRFVRSVVGPFVESGQLRGQDPDVVAEAVAAIPYLTLHRDGTGGDDHRKVMDLVIETFARGLVADAGSDG